MLSDAIEKTEIFLKPMPARKRKRNLEIERNAGKGPGQTGRYRRTES